MRKLLTTILLSTAFFVALPASAQVKKIDLYFFYGQGCPHCADEEVLLDKIDKQDDNVTIHRYEVWYNPKNADFLARLSDEFGWSVQGVPFTVVGSQTFSGYLNEETTGRQIENALRSCLSSDCPDYVGDYIRGLRPAAASTTPAAIKNIKLPIFGDINITNISLPLFTVAIAALDGLNPCALWVLIFLASMLLSLNDKKKLLVLGSIFILSSAIFYFLVIAAWLKLLVFLGFIQWLRIAIGLVALSCGYYYIKKWRDEIKTCNTVDEAERKKILAKAKAIISLDNFWLAVGGIAALSISVSLFEMICSAGLPAVYTQVLAISELSAWQHYAYLFLYILIFKAYEIIILVLALTTMKIKAVNPKTILRIGLAGGVIMLILGLLLLFKPAWLMFG